MYKVFINEKRLSFTDSIRAFDKNLKFENPSVFDVAVDLLTNTSKKAVNIFGHDVESIWDQFQKHFQNIFGAGGVVFNERNEILFIYRLGKWDLPKGKMEQGESKSETALREVEEECSISNLAIDHFIETSYHMYRDRQGQMVLKIVHWFRMNHQGNQTPKPQEIEGITKALWLPQNKIKSLVLPNTFRNIKMILEKTLK